MDRYIFIESLGGTLIPPTGGRTGLYTAIFFAAADKKRIFPSERVHPGGRFHPRPNQFIRAGLTQNTASRFGK